jgi:hypothetical protein
MGHARTEFLLPAACCRWPPDDARRAAIRGATDAPIDWHEFRAIVERHRIWGLAHQALSAAAVRVPPDIAREIASEASAIAHQSLALAAEAVRLQRLFDENKITGALFLKGVSLAMLAYGTLALKHGKDIDILVALDDLETASSVLERGGYERREPPTALTGAQLQAISRVTFHFTFVHRETNHVVELHWRLRPNPYFATTVV